MRSTSHAALAAALVAAMLALAGASPARAQQAQGFALERLSQASPGSGFIANDDLRWPAGLAGAVSLSLGYAHAPLSLDAGSGTDLVVVRHQTSADLAFAVSWDRLRFGLHFSSPVYVAGDSGAAQGRLFTGPSANLEHNPDTLSDVALSADWRLLGDATSPVRWAASGTVFIPSGERADYATDGTWRGLLKLNAAGEAGRFTWAGSLGFHFRPLDDSLTPGSPHGSEFHFGAAATTLVPLGGVTLAVGPEIFAVTLLSSSFTSQTTGAEALLGARLDATPFAGGVLRVKLGAGAAIHHAFGAPLWRAVVGVELGGLAERVTE